ncbi:MAG: hypothetical protein H0V15_01985 [Solirubrobacterales bacterium]|nr:hypothetical protein [Solirubrobacterales bacterium]
MTATQAQIDTIDVRIMPDPEEGPVTPDGPLRSIQEAELSMPRDTLEELWNPATLERLARAYWRYLNKISFGLLKIGYGATGRYVVFGWRRLVLLSFRLPEYDVGPGFGRVTWPIERGVLVAERGRGYLRIDVRRLEPDPGRDEERVRIRAMVSNFYPLLRGSGWFARVGSFFYSQTQLRIHVLVTRGFLRSLESGDLPPLRPGREAVYQAADEPAEARGRN